MPPLPPTIDIVTFLCNLLQCVREVEGNNHKEKNFNVQRRTTCQNSLNHDKCTKIIQLFPSSFVAFYLEKFFILLMFALLSHALSHLLIFILGVEDALFIVCFHIRSASQIVAAG